MILYIVWQAEILKVSLESFQIQKVLKTSSMSQVGGPILGNLVSFTKLLYTVLQIAFLPYLQGTYEM